MNPIQVVYIATGKSYASQANESAQRLRELGYDDEILLISDSKYEGCEMFDEIDIIDDPAYGLADKPENILRPQAEKVIYLDADTYVVDESALTDLFDILEKFELAGTIDTRRRLELSEINQESSIGVPRSFPWLNTGVLALRMNPSTRDFLKDWWRIHQQLMEIYGPLNDQAAFRRALWESEVSHTVLPPEYNFRLPYPQSVKGKVRILHGVSENYQGIVKTVNRRPTEQWRQYRRKNTGSVNKLSEVGKWRNRLDSVKWLLRNEGMTSLISRGYKEVVK